MAISNAYRHTITGFSFSKVALLYGCVLSMTLLHEIGHAAAAYRFGIVPKGIGFGFYFLLPVFYTDVTGIWALPRMQRIIVNLGGIYFQLIANIPLVLLFHVSGHSTECCFLIVANTASLLVSLNPFLRYDGYWVFSDAFNIHNLNRRSQEIYNGLLNRKMTLRDSPIPLILYTFFKAIFWAIICCYCMDILITSINGMTSIATENTAGNTIKPASLFTVSLLAMVIVLFKLIFTIKAKQYVPK